MPALNYDPTGRGDAGGLQAPRADRVAQEDHRPVPDQTEASLLFRLGELYWEESKFHEFEANRKDDDLIKAMNRNDAAGQARAKAEGGAAGQGQAVRQARARAVHEDRPAVPDFERTDEVLFFLGQFLRRTGTARRWWPTSAWWRSTPRTRGWPSATTSSTTQGQAHGAGARPSRSKRAAEFTESQVYAYALYKQGWCYFNMPTTRPRRTSSRRWCSTASCGAAAEKDGGKSGKSGLVKEARGDYVRTYARDGDVMTAKDDFSKVATKPEDRYDLKRWRTSAMARTARRPSPTTPSSRRSRCRPSLGLPGEDRRPRAGQQGAHRGPGAPPGEDHQGSGGLRHRQGGQGQETAGRGQRAGRAHPVQPRCVTWHNEARKTRDEETFKYADAIYGDYLTLFPENPKAYDHAVLLGEFSTTT